LSIPLYYLKFSAMPYNELSLPTFRVAEPLKEALA